MGLQNCYGLFLTTVFATGPVPEGADAVVQVEDTQVVEDGAGNVVKKIRVLKAVTKGHDIRPVVIFEPIFLTHLLLLQNWRKT